MQSRCTPRTLRGRQHQQQQQHRCSVAGTCVGAHVARVNGSRTGNNRTYRSSPGGHVAVAVATEEEEAAERRRRQANRQASAGVDPHLAADPRQIPKSDPIDRFQRKQRVDGR